MAEEASKKPIFEFTGMVTPEITAEMYIDPEQLYAEMVRRKQDMVNRLIGVTILHPFDPLNVDKVEVSVSEIGAINLLNEIKTDTKKRAAEIILLYGLDAS